MSQALSARMQVVTSTGSTNLDLLQAARAGAAEGSWLRAERQEAGRGRVGRRWLSPPGNLYASTIVRLRAGDPSAAGLALVAGVALEEAASPYAGEGLLQLKWPNDLLAGPAKLAGILLDREGQVVVIGFGVNLATAPEVSERPATALARLGGTPPEPDALLHALADAFTRWLNRWRSEGLEPVRRRWLERAHPIGSALATTGHAGRTEGLFDGLEPDGALRLRHADGTLEIVRAGDVLLI